MFSREEGDPGDSLKILFKNNTKIILNWLMTLLQPLKINKFQSAVTTKTDRETSS